MDTEHCSLLCLVTITFHDALLALHLTPFDSDTATKWCTHCIKRHIVTKSGFRHSLGSDKVERKKV